MKRSFPKSGKHSSRLSPDAPVLTIRRTIMLAGHETTSKAVGTLSAAVFF